MIQSMKISNFKGFKEIDLPRFSRITLFGGMNNVGKSSVLDAIFLLFGAYRQDLFINQYGLRGINEIALNKTDMWTEFFYNLNTEEKITITLNEGNNLYTLSCGIEHNYEPNAKTRGRQIFVQNINDNITIPSHNLIGGHSVSERGAVEVTLKNNDKIIYKAHIPKSPLQPITIDKPLNESLAPATVLMPDRRRSIDARVLSELDISNQTDLIIELIKIIEPRIKGLSLAQVSKHGDIYVDIGLSRKMPIKMMGDGIIHLLSMLLAIANSKRGVLLIDEIENGLYYESMPLVWKGIYKACRIFDCQIIATTHSYECLKSAFQSFDKKNDDFNYVRLERNEEGIRAETYDYDDLEWAFEHDLEIR